MAADLLDDIDFYDFVDETPPHLRRKTFAVEGVFGVLSDIPCIEEACADYAPVRLPDDGSLTCPTAEFAPDDYLFDADVVVV